MNNNKESKDKAKEAFEAIRNLLKYHDFVSNSLLHWDEAFLKEVYLIAFNEIDNLEDFLGWLNYAAKITDYDEDFFKNIFREEFPGLTKKYSISAIFNALTECWEWCAILKDEKWCRNIFEQYIDCADSAMSFSGLGKFALKCCKDENMAIRAIKLAEKHCATFEEFCQLASFIVNDLHNDAWGLEVLLATSAMVKNNEEAGKVLSIANAFRDENLYTIIQSKILNRGK